MADSASGQDQPILVLGATGAVGGFLIERLRGHGVMLLAVSRRQPARAAPHAVWFQHDLDTGTVEAHSSVLVSLGPVRHALEQVRQGRGVGRAVVLSSASTLFKAQSSDRAERALMAELIDLESELVAECRARSIGLTLIKSTMIYGSGADANVTRVAGLLARLGVAPYCGRGLRQPVHADDLAAFVIKCLGRGPVSHGIWIVGGGESLSYPAMLKRIASASDRSCRLLPVPGALMKLGLKAAHWRGRLRDIRPVMIDRQRRDLTVDDQPAREHLDWRPRPFRP